MLAVAEESLVLERAVKRGDLEESEVPPETASLPQGHKLQFGRRLDRLVTRGRLTEQQVIQLLNDVRRDSWAKSETIDPGQNLSAATGGQAPAPRSSKAENQPTEYYSAEQLEESAATAREPMLAQTIDGSQLDGRPTSLAAPALTVRYPVENWSRYEFLQLLGQGGMGAVYKARDKRLGRLVALKFIRGGDDRLTQRFMQEARAQSRLEHDGICRVLEVGEVEGKSYIAMQLINGPPLDQLGPTLTLIEKVQVLRDVALAMHYAHEQGIIHRDIKPANIMIERGTDGRLLPRVMDFGLARETSEGKGLTETGAVMGTPAYMSPEQAQGEARRLDRRSDVYSLGATLFDVLTGRAPFDDESAVNIILKVLAEEAPTLRSYNPRLPAALDIICSRCLAKDKTQRYQTAQALADDLTRFLNAERINARRISPLQRLKWRAQRNKPAAALVLSLIVSLIGFAGYGLRARYVAQKRAELARQIGQDSKDIEWILRTAYALPLHNVEHEQGLVRKRMELIERRLHSYGDLAAGLASYTLGRGRLSLNEHKQARQYLEQAQKQGLHTPELQAALGRVLGELYREALVQARRSGEKAWVEQRQKELRKEFLEPAIAALTQALSHRDELALDSVELISGLLDFYNERYEDADRHALAALAETPWLSEAVKLRGEIAHAQALKQIGQGHYDAARTLLDQAITHFQRAADISRSDGRIHSALARAFMDLAEVNRFQGKPRDKEFEQAQAAAERSITTTPSDGSGYLERARVLYFVSKALGNRSADTVTSCNQSIASAEQALKYNPDDFIAWDTLGNALVYRGVYEQRKGNPEATWQQAVRALEKTIALAPNFPWAHNDLGACRLFQGNYLFSHGQDPRPVFLLAIEEFKRAASLDPTYQFAYGNILGTFAQFADYSLGRGQDFSALVKDAEQQAKICAASCEIYPTFQRNMTFLQVSFAQYLLLKGEDPRNALSRVRRYTANLIKLAKPSYTTYLISSFADYLEAEYLLEIGLDPTALTDAVIGMLPAWKALDEQGEDPFVLEARINLIRAGWATRQKISGLPAAESARQAARKAVELNPSSHEAAAEHVRACQKLAALSAPQAQDELLAEGLTAADKGLKLKADAGVLWALRAVVLSAQARLARNPAAQANLAKESTVSWTKALEINPLLARTYGKELRGE